MVLCGQEGGGTDTRLFVDAVFCGILVIQLIHWISWSRSEKRFTKIIVVSISCALIVACRRGEGGVKWHNGVQSEQLCWGVNSGI